MNDLRGATPEQQLQMLREQTRLTGGLHEAQVIHLKAWPLLLWQEAKSTSFTWDPDSRSIIFDLNHRRGASSLKKDQKWWQQRVDVLTGWVQQLLGDEWMVRVVSGSRKFTGYRKVVSDAGSQRIKS